MFVSAWRHAYEGVVSAESLRQLDEGNVAEWLGKVMSTGESVTIVAEPENSRILGFCRYGADPNEAAKGHIFSLYVLPSAAGHGVGSRLLTAALEGLALRGLDTVREIWVLRRTNLRADSIPRLGSSQMASGTWSLSTAPRKFGSPDSQEGPVERRSPRRTDPGHY